MRLEISIEGSPPLFFPIDKPKLTFGSSRKCDISLPIVGISRNHFEIDRIGDEIFITDLNSTNGTFINDERLEPNKRTKVLVFFKIHIGDHITIALSHDDEKTDSINTALMMKDSSQKKPDDSKKNTSEKAQPKIEPNRQKEIKVSSQPQHIHEKSNQNLKSLLGVLILAAGIFYFYDSSDESSNLALNSPPPTNATTQPVAPVTEVVSEKSLLIPANEITPKESFSNLLNDIKCTIDLEKYLCDKFSSKISGKFGAIQVGTSLNLLIDGSTYIKDAETILLKRRTIENLSENERNEFKVNSEKIALALFLQDFPNDFTYSLFTDKKLNIAFYSAPNGAQEELLFIAAFLPESLMKAKEKMTPSTIKELRRRGVNAVNFLTTYYSHY